MSANYNVGRTSKSMLELSIGVHASQSKRRACDCQKYNKLNVKINGVISISV